MTGGREGIEWLSWGAGEGFATEEGRRKRGWWSWWCVANGVSVTSGSASTTSLSSRSSSWTSIVGCGGVVGGVAASEGGEDEMKMASSC